MKKLRLFLIAGENSGDLHGSNLIKAILRLYPDTELQGLGGPRMEKAGMKLRYNMVRDLAIIGLAGVLKNFFLLRRLILETEQYLKDTKPDAIILIDYAGFNIRMAQRAKNLGIKVVWYISPQIWAWHKERIYTLARVVDLMIVILPFEAGLYKTKNVNVVHVGHPLFDVIELNRTKKETYDEFGLDVNRPLITLVPGSRKREVQDFLRIMLEGAKRYHELHPRTQFALIRAISIDPELIDDIIADERLPFPVHIIDKHAYDIRRWADFSWVKSGTSTLEAAIIGAPHLIVYKVNFLTWFIGKQLFTISFIGLPNIVAGRAIVPELLQDEFTPLKLVEQTEYYLESPEEFTIMVNELQRVKDALGEPGASEKAARAIFKELGIALPENPNFKTPLSLPV